MISEWIKEFEPKNEEELSFSFREVMQSIILAGLSRTDFFGKAAFYGGTALRIFHGLNRFSEDLDFSLLKKDPTFSFAPYFEVIQNEFAAQGIEVSLHEKKKKESAIHSAFLKAGTLTEELVLESIVKQLGVKTNKTIKIKIEIDREPPLGFQTEELLLIRPFSFYVNCFELPSLFAGKLHALLFRKWKNRVKGRDWYDFEWYIRKGVPLDVSHFIQRAKDTGDWKNTGLPEVEISHLLEERIQQLNMNQVKEDVMRFIPNDDSLNIWSTHYFIDLSKKIKFVH